MAVAVPIDSSSGVTPELADEFHVRLIPIHLMWDKKEYADWVDMTMDEFYARLKTSETLPTTSGSVQGEFYSAFEELRGKVDGVVAITLAANTPSAGYRSAVMAQEMVEGIPIEVVDSQIVMTPLGLVATAAARATDAGASLQDVVKAAKSVIPKMNLFVNPGSISYFLRGGRISESEVDSREESYIITVIKEASEEASRVAEKKAGFARAITAVVLRARKTVNKTPDLLPVLKEAGVVDAGAKGLYYFFKGMESAICRPKPSSHIRSVRKTHTPAPPARKEERRVYGFDVQFLLEGEALPVEEIRNRVIASGECPLVVGDEKLLKAHVHTMNPDEILDYARSKGTLSDIVIEDMDQQVQKQAREGKRHRQQ